MMTKNHLIAGVLGAGLLVSASGCESVVDDLNDDPNNFTTITLDLALNQAQLNQASLVGGLPAHLAAMWTDQFTGGDRQYITFDNYQINAGSFDEIWEDIYQRGIVQAVEAEEIAAAQGANLQRGAALILQGYYLGEAASMFGDVPFQQANNITEFTDPQYESQGDVLRGAIALIDEGLALVGDGTVQTTGPQIYAFNPTWASVGNGLRARYFLGLMEYEQALAAANASGMADPSDDLAIASSSTNFGENLYWQFEIEQRTSYLVVDNASRGISYFRELLSDTTGTSRNADDDKTDDSARYAYFIEVGDNFADNVRYNVTDGFAAIDAPLRIITGAEVQLIRAEAAARTGDEDQAIEALNAGREYWDTLLGTDNYDELDDDDLPDDTQELVREILTEKFLSVIGLPTFYDYTRTRNLIGTNSEGVAAPAQRFLYPSTELSSNDNFPGLQPLTVPLPLYR